jgi:hypothetical protein
MRYLTNLSLICRDALQPVFFFFLIGCFLLIALGLWAVTSSGARQQLCAAMFGVAPVVAAFPVVVFSGALITCAVSDYDSPSAGIPPLSLASLELQFPRN